MNKIMEAITYNSVKNNPKNEPIFSSLLKKNPALFANISKFKILILLSMIF